MWEFLLAQTNKNYNGGTFASVQFIIWVNGVFSQNGDLNFKGVKNLEQSSFMFMKSFRLIKTEIINPVRASSNRSQQ